MTFLAQSLFADPAENNERLANLVSPYGVGTHSYNGSTEKKELDRQRAAVTKAFESSPRRAIAIGPFCRCLSFRLPHSPERHRDLKSDYDWRSAADRGDIGIDLAPRQKQVRSDVPGDILQEWYA